MVMPEMITDLQLTYTQAGVINGLSQASSLLTIPLAGYLAYRIGGLRMIVASQLLGCMLLAALGLVQGYYSLLVINFLIRGWPIFVWIPMVAVASEYINKEWRATMLTVTSSGPCLFIFFDGVLSSYFLEHFHWRSLWFFTAFICLACCCCCFLALQLVQAWHHSAADQTIRHRYDTELAQWLKTRSGVILFALFAIIGFTFMSFQVYLAPFLREELGIDLRTTAVMWSIMGVSGIMGGVCIGMFTDRFGVKTSFGLVFIMAMTSTIILCYRVEPYGSFAMAVLFGASQAAVYGLGPAYLAKILSTKSATAAFSWGTMVLTAGAMIGNFLGGWSEGKTGSFAGFYISLGVLFAAGAVLSSGLKNEKRQVAD